MFRRSRAKEKERERERRERREKKEKEGKLRGKEKEKEKDQKGFSEKWRRWLTKAEISKEDVEEDSETLVEVMRAQEMLKRKDKPRAPLRRFHCEETKPFDIPSHVYGIHAQAIYAFSAVKEGDLGFAEGDIIYDIFPKEGKKWWSGRCETRFGKFPSNYIKPLQAKVLYNFPGTFRGDLPLTKNGFVTNISFNLSLNWWEGEHLGRKGKFPCNYIELGRVAGVYKKDSRSPRATSPSPSSPTPSSPSQQGLGPPPPIPRRSTSKKVATRPPLPTRPTTTSPTPPSSSSSSSFLNAPGQSAQELFRSSSAPNREFPGHGGGVSRPLPVPSGQQGRGRGVPVRGRGRGNGPVRGGGSARSLPLPTPPTSSSSSSSSSSASGAGSSRSPPPPVPGRRRGEDWDAPLPPVPVEDGVLLDSFEINGETIDLVSFNVDDPPSPSPVPTGGITGIREEDPHDLWDVTKEIGVGATATVYHAVDLATQKDVAIKCMELEIEPKPGVFYHEVHLMGMCQHPNIVQYVDCIIFEAALWVAMEFVPGETLTDVIEMSHDNANTKLLAPSLPFIQYTGYSLLSAFKFLHSLHILHRDIKSDNVIVTWCDGSVKLMDFGFGCQLTEKENKRKSVVGTAFWMAPEVIKSNWYDEKIDIWSFGALLYELAEGAPPYFGAPPIKAMFQICKKGMPALSNPTGVLSPQEFNSLNLILSKCTNSLPENRPSAEELLQDPFFAKMKERGRDKLCPLLPMLREKIL